MRPVSNGWTIQGILLIHLFILLQLGVSSISLGLLDGHVLSCGRIWSIFATHQSYLLLVLLILFFAPDLHALTLNQTQRNGAHTLDAISEFCNRSEERL